MFNETVQNFLTPKPIRVLLIDPHPIVLLGLSAALDDNNDYEIVGKTNMAASIMDLLKLKKPDIVLIDHHLPNKEGLKLIKEIQAAGGSELKIVIHTAILTEAETCELIKIGVKGILLKEMSTGLITQCLQQVYSGGEWLERRSMRMAFEQILRRESAFQVVAEHLSSREMTLAALIAKGHSSKSAARELQITEGSVRVYLNRIYSKLKVTNRLQLALLFKEKGLS